MSTILHLQKLTPSVSAADFNAALASSVSYICPTTVVGEEFRQFEMD